MGNCLSNIMRLVAFISWHTKVITTNQHGLSAPVMFNQLQIVAGIVKHLASMFDGCALFRLEKPVVTFPHRRRYREALHTHHAAHSLKCSSGITQAERSANTGTSASPHWMHILNNAVRGTHAFQQQHYFSQPEKIQFLAFIFVYYHLIHRHVANKHHAIVTGDKANGTS